CEVTERPECGNRCADGSFGSRSRIRRIFKNLDGREGRRKYSVPFNLTKFLLRDPAASLTSGLAQTPRGSAIVSLSGHRFRSCARPPFNDRLAFPGEYLWCPAKQQEWQVPFATRDLRCPTVHPTELALEHRWRVPTPECSAAVSPGELRSRLRDRRFSPSRRSAWLCGYTCQSRKALGPAGRTPD